MSRIWFVAFLSTFVCVSAFAGRPGPITAEADVVRVNDKTMYTLFTHGIGGFMAGHEEGGMANEWTSIPPLWLLDLRVSTRERVLAPGRHIVVGSPGSYMLGYVAGTTIGEPGVRGNIGTVDLAAKTYSILLPWGYQRTMTYRGRYSDTTVFRLNGAASTPEKSLAPGRRVIAVRARPFTLSVLSETASAQAPSKNNDLLEGVVDNTNDMRRNKFVLSVPEAGGARKATITFDRLGTFLLDLTESTPEETIVAGRHMLCMGGERPSTIFACSDRPGDTQGKVKSYTAADGKLVVGASVGADAKDATVSVTSQTPILLDLMPSTPDAALKQGREVTVLEDRPESVDVFTD